MSTSMAILSITLINMLLFSILSQRTNKFEKLATGNFPRAVEKTNLRVLLIHNTDAFEFDDAAIIHSIISSNKNLLRTDIHSSLFRLNSEKLVLLSETPLKITVFNEAYDNFKTWNADSSYANVLDDSYRFSVISDSSFLVSWVNTNKYQIRIFNLDSTGNIQEDTKKKDISCSNCKSISCVYYSDNSQHVCAYINSASTIEIEVIRQNNFQTVRVSNINKSNADNLHMSYIELNIFSLCYYQGITFDKKANCTKFELDNSNSQVIDLGVPVPVISDVVDLNTNFDTLVVKRSLYTVITEGTILTLNQHKSDMKIIGKPEAGGTEDHLSFPSIFTIGTDIVGYVYVKTPDIWMRSIIFPICEDQSYFTKVANFLPLSFDFTINNSKPTTGQVAFYQLPLNALLRNNGEFVLFDKEYNINTNPFELITFEAGNLIISYVGLTSRSSTSVCNVKITICYQTCDTCTNVIPSIANHQCTKCITDYHYIEGNTDICYNDNTKPQDYYYNSTIDQYSQCDSSCMSCQIESTTCIECNTGYYPIENTSNCALKNKLPQYHYFDDVVNIIRKCYDTCETCSSFGTMKNNNCITCRTPNSKNNPYDSTGCGTKCDLKWTFNKKANAITCVTECATPNSYHVPLNNQCVSSCKPFESGSDCIICQEKRLFQNNGNECIDTCPPDKRHDYINNKCLSPDDPDEPGPNPNPPGPLPNPDPDNKNKRTKIYEEYNGRSATIANFVLSNQINNYFTRIGELIKEHDTTIDLIYHFIGEDYTYTFYRLSDSNIGQYVYNTQNVSQIDFSTLQSKLFESNSITSSEDVIIMQLDIERKSELTNQTEYVLYNKNGVKLNIASVLNKSIAITFPIRNKNDSHLIQSEKLIEKGIDIYNRSCPFYNDVCFKYTSEKERDVILSDRRVTYYPSNEICPINCEYESIDYNSFNVKCKCSFQELFPYADKVIPNPKAIAFTNKDYQTYNAVACPQSVFNNDIVTNVSFWVFLSFLIAIIVLSFCFICSGMTYANNYVNEVLKSSSNKPQGQAGTQDENNSLPPNPPKSIESKSTSRSADKSSQSKIEEEVFGNVINRNDKGNPLKQNYIKRLETNSSCKDGKAVINKLKDALMGENNQQNFNVEAYYFTRNSANESNPMYSKNGNTDNIFNTETGQSFSSSNFRKKFNNELFEFNDDIGNENGKGNNNNSIVYDQNEEYSRRQDSNIQLKISEQRVKENSEGVKPKNKTKTNNLLIKSENINQNKQNQLSNPDNLNKDNILYINNNENESSNSSKRPIHNNKDIDSIDNNYYHKTSKYRSRNQNQKQIRERDDDTPELSRTDGLINFTSKSVLNKFETKDQLNVKVSKENENKNKQDKNVGVKIPYAFCRAYFNYCKKREIFLITFCSNKSYLPFFITFPIFLFCCTIMFTLHALFFTNDFIHRRFIEEGDINASYWFRNEFLKCFYVALVGNVVKIIIVKILIFLVFRIEKKILCKQNQNVILQRLRCKSTAIFVVIICLMVALFYINTCYSGLYPNTESGLFIGYAVTILLSFIIAMALCFVINIIRLIGIGCNCS